MKSSRQDNARINLTPNEISFLHTASVCRRGHIGLMRQYLEVHAQMKFPSDSCLSNTFRHYYGVSPKQHYVAYERKR